MEPLTTALLGALSAAAGALAGGAADAAASDAWAATKAKLAGWAQLTDRAQQAAFAQAIGAAVARMRREWPDSSQVDDALAVLTGHGPEAAAFARAAVEQLLLSATPDQGYLLDLYRRQLRFSAALRAEDLPDWGLVEPVLTAFLGMALPTALRAQRALRPLLLEQAQLQALDVARATYAAIREQTAVLARFAALRADMQSHPFIQATITAAPGSTISNAPVNILLRDYTNLPPITSAELEVLFSQYREYIRAQHERLDFRGILHVQNMLRLPLEAIYVPLRGSAPAPRPQLRPARGDAHTTPRPHLRLPEELLDAAPTSTASGIALHQLIQTQPRLVILGDPGTGKSTMMKYVMLSLLRNQGGERLGMANAWLPILFPIAEFAKACEHTHSLAPLEYLRAFYTSVSLPGVHQLFERALLSGRAMVLFDGLDEVRDTDDRKGIVSRIETFVRRWDMHGNRFLATSRIAGYDAAPLDATLFAQTEVQLFDAADIEQFAAKWGAAYEQVGWAGDADAGELKRNSAEHTAALLQAIRANEQAAELARNPLLLTMLALIRVQGTTLPSRRVELYKLCIETLAETWNRVRSLSGQPLDVYLAQNHQKLDARFVVNLLSPIALWLHAERPGGLAEQRELEHQLEHVFRDTYGKSKGEANDLARDFLALVEQKTGLLQARGKHLYGFLHLTLEEYLAAQALHARRFDEPDMLHAYTTQPGWREVVRLYVASIESPRGMQQALNELLKTPTTPATLGIPAVRAGECLLDLAPTDITEQARRAVINALLAAIADAAVPIATRVEAGQTLGRLGDPRLLDPATGEALGMGQYDRVEPYWCPIAQGPFWFGDDRARDKVKRGGPRFDPGRLTQVTMPHEYAIARYPVTNAEFARFLAANGPQGYDPAQPWWTAEGRKFLHPGGHRLDNQDAFVRYPRYWEDASLNSPAQPVVGVSWYEAAAYCRWLTQLGRQEGWLAIHARIRLPTALEWERAARHTDTRPFPWGTAAPTAQHANYQDAGVGAPTPVGCFRTGRAACGAEDLIGNTFEWLATSYGAGTDPVPQKDFTLDSDVGLSYTYYGDDIEQLCCGARDRNDPNDRDDDCSFRVVQSRALG